MGAASLTDRKSAHRSQFAVSHALHYGMSKKLASVLGSGLPPRVFTIKRLWDETSICLQLNFADLVKLLGKDMANAAREIKVTGRGARYPEYVVQSMQQIGPICWGSRREEGCEIVVPGKIISSSDSEASSAA